METIKPEMFGRDHWSVVLYAESRAVDFDGSLNPANMRLNSGSRGSRYPTTLRDGTRVESHDEICCLYDLESAGVLSFSESSMQIRLTDLGWFIAGKLRRRRSERLQDRFSKWEDLIEGYKTDGVS